jgi:hypothetical protein
MDPILIHIRDDLQDFLSLPDFIQFAKGIIEKFSSCISAADSPGIQFAEEAVWKTDGSE